MGHLDEQIIAMHGRGLSVEAISRQLQVRLSVVERTLFDARSDADQLRRLIREVVREIAHEEVEEALERRATIARRAALRARRRLSYPAISRIVSIVADLAQITVAEMIGDRRSQHLARPRQIAMLIASEETTASLPTIGSCLGNRDHTTVLHGIRRARQMLASDPAMAALYRAAKDRLLAGSERDGIDG